MQFKEDFFEKYTFHEIIILFLQKGITVELPLTGHCMKPLLRENELITIKPIASNKLQCGDIALYHINGRLKCHRFLKFITINENQYLITKSDRRLGYDPPVPQIYFLGIVIRVKKGDKIVNYETKRWKCINYCLGKLSSYLSKTEYYIKSLILFPLKFANKCFKMVMGVGFLKYVKSLKRA